MMLMTAVLSPTISAWSIDPVHSVVEFRVKHMMISNVKGQFTGVSGILSLDERNVEDSSIAATVEVSSLNTSDVQRDAHLKSADFFDAENFPTISLRSSRIKSIPDGGLLVSGQLSIRGVTRDVEFAVDGPSKPAKDPWGNTRIGLSATTRINRKDFGLTWNAALEAGGFLVGEEVAISLDLQFLKA
jgi:polyisoprenoid-binding protein YceI